MSTNTRKCLLIVALLLVTFCLGAQSISETFTNRHAAQIICINADAYSDPAPTVEDILGDAVPYETLTNLAGCQMLLRAFGPLPDVQEGGVRDLVKYRSCAFTDVPEEGKAAVENLTNAGLYIPLDNTKFGPYEEMTKHELCLLIDRIHAFLQSNPKDDFYSWSTADLLNDPEYLRAPYDISYHRPNTFNEKDHQAWELNMLNDCLANPDTPEKANIRAFLSTYMDQEERENSMTYIQPMVDAIWNAPTFADLVNICADICRETGIEILLNTLNWQDWSVFSFYDEGDGHLTQGFYLNFYEDEDAEDFVKGAYIYEAEMEQIGRLLQYLGFDKDVAESATLNYIEGIRRQGIIAYENSTLPKGSVWCTPDDDSEDFPGFPFKSYLERAGFDYRERVHLDNGAAYAVFIEMMMKEENLPGAKVGIIRHLIDALSTVVPAHIRDAVNGYWGDVYAADPSMIFDDLDMSYYLFPFIQTDTYMYYSKTDEYQVMHERLEGICRSIMSYYRTMLENESWLSEKTRSTVIDKLDNMKMALLIPDDMSDLFGVSYTSADEGGILFENLTRYLKGRRQWLSERSTGVDLPFYWSIVNNWDETFYYSKVTNMYFINMNAIIGSYVKADSSYEYMLGNLGFFTAHEISHAFDKNGSLFNKEGKKEDLWTPEDRAQFNARCVRLGEYMCGYEYFPGFSYSTWDRIIDETVADLTALKCLMSIAAQIPGFNYAECFASFANVLADSSTRRGIVEYVARDEHPGARCRVNRPLSLLDEFYSTFDVGPGDAMYVAPEDRPYVW